VGGCVTAEHVDEADILFERRGVAGVVTLNRPQALNAVSLAMVRALTQQLVQWESDPAVTRVIVTANGGRAFSAGGDLRALYDFGRAGRHDEALEYFREEYALNARSNAIANLMSRSSTASLWAAASASRSMAPIASPATGSSSPCRR
jgi:enoyl-CoA hydratase/carnithine racemase